MNRSSPTRQSAAFTLIELLVVISIIVLLVSLLLPALRSARDAGKSVQCLSNQRQNAVAMLQYEHDHAGFLPPFKAPVSNANFVDPFFFQYIPYLYMDDIIETQKCPSDDFLNPTDTGVRLTPLPRYGTGMVDGGFIFSYAMNGSLPRRNNTALNDRFFYPRAYNEIEELSSTMLTLETQGSSLLQHNSIPETFHRLDHGSGRSMNLAMADGHAANWLTEDMRAGPLVNDSSLWPEKFRRLWFGAGHRNAILFLN